MDDDGGLGTGAVVAASSFNLRISESLSKRNSTSDSRVADFAAGFGAGAGEGAGADAFSSANSNVTAGPFSDKRIISPEFSQ